MSNQVILGTLLFTQLLIPFVYGNFYEPDVLNKTRDYYVVSRIERRTLTFRKYIFIYVWLWIVAAMCEEVWLLIQKDSSARVSMIAAEVLVLIVWTGLAWACCRNHTSLPLKRYLNVKEMIQSIESERFYEVGRNLWYSRNWIRVSTKFYPKSAITAIRIDDSRGTNALATVVVYTVWGKEYRCNDFNRYDKALDDKIDNLIKTLPISELADLEKGGMRNRLRGFDGSAMANAYMQTHSTTEFIEQPDVLSAIVNIARKR